MGSRPKHKMSIQDRAKQFSPFKALSGLEKALEAAEREMEKTEKREPSDEDSQIINKQLKMLKGGGNAIITYYHEGEYVSLSGNVKAVDAEFRFVKMGETVIPIDDIYKIDILL